MSATTTSMATPRQASGRRGTGLRNRNRPAARSTGPAPDDGGGVDLSGDELEGALSREKTLAEHLHDQLSAAPDWIARPGRGGGAHRLGRRGRLPARRFADMAERLGCSPELIDQVLAVLQGFEPTGVFARDVRECLTLQLKERDRFDPAMAALLDNLDLLVRRDTAALRRACGVDEDDLKEMIAELRALTPRPGARSAANRPSRSCPTSSCARAAGGRWHVELNTDTLPRLLVDRRYHARVAGVARTDAEKTFVSECLASANWLVKSLDQRAKTILKVASEIVRQQDGVPGLRRGAPAAAEPEDGGRRHRHA